MSRTKEKDAVIAELKSRMQLTELKLENVENTLGELKKDLLELLRMKKGKQ